MTIERNNIVYNMYTFIQNNLAFLFLALNSKNFNILEIEFSFSIAILH